MTVMTTHGKKRMRQRVGANRSAAKKMLQRVWRKGLTHKQTEGKLSDYITALYLKNPQAGQVRLYGDKTYIFKNNGILITVFQTPERFIPEVKRLKEKCETNEKAKECMVSIEEAAKYFGIRLETIQHWISSRYLLPENNRIDKSNMKRLVKNYDRGRVCRRINVHYHYAENMLSFYMYMHKSYETDENDKQIEGYCGDPTLKIRAYTNESRDKYFVEVGCCDENYNYQLWETEVENTEEQKRVFQGMADFYYDIRNSLVSPDIFEYFDYVILPQLSYLTGGKKIIFRGAV